MAKWTLKSYNQFLGASMSHYGLNRKQAAQMYRDIRARENKPVFKSYIKQHPRISKRIAERSIMRKPPTTPEKRIEEVKLMPEYPEDILDELDFDQEGESSEDFESPDIQ